MSGQAATTDLLAARVLEEPKVTRQFLALMVTLTVIGYAEYMWAALVYPPPVRPTGTFQFPPFAFFHLQMLRQTVLGFFDWFVMGSAMVYATLLVLLFQRPIGKRILRPLVAAGRMALTTYLTQSIVCTLLFYSYGLGWYGSFGYSGMLAVTITLYAIQMVVSMWWLTRFRFGPAEWLWRALTYGRGPAMRLVSLS